VKFYLGTHRPNWLGKTDIPLFISHRVLDGRKTFPRALGPWALDSGGFTEIDTYGRWVTTEPDYIQAVARYAREIGRLEWAAPMDWMCEPHMTARTGLTVREHQQRTVENYLRLRDHGPFIPVLQGWEPGEYLACVDLYAQHGVDLTALPLVGVGSVCRRQSAHEIGWIFRTLAGQGIRCHGFGVKKAGLRRYGEHLASADSLAWSYEARRNPPMAGCAHGSCANCLGWALRWRDELLNQGTQLEMAA
jgi:hypothetical protein